MREVTVHGGNQRAESNHPGFLPVVCLMHSSTDRRRVAVRSAHCCGATAEDREDNESAKRRENNGFHNASVSLVIRIERRK